MRIGCLEDLEGSSGVEKKEAVPSSNMEEQEDSEDEGLREYVSAIKPV